MGLDGQSQSLLNALQSMTAIPPDYSADMSQTRPDHFARSLNRSHGTDSSLSTSPYNSSPSLISPIYDPAAGPPLPYGAGSANLPLHHPQPLHPPQHTAHQYWNSTPSMPPPSAMPPSDYNRQMYDTQSFPQQSHHQEQPRYHSQPQIMAYQQQQPQDMGYLSQSQQGQTQGPVGRYVVQGDGSQIYIPYNQE
jgi:hypothetical protein